MQPSLQSEAAQSLQISASPRDELRNGFRAGLAPLAWLAVFLAVALALVVVVRLATAAQSFSVQQNATVIAFAAGLALAAAVYVISIVRVFRSMRAWRLAGAIEREYAALWALAVTGLIVVLPIVIAALLPQHPAPILPPFKHSAAAPFVVHVQVRT